MTQQPSKKFSLNSYDAVKSVLMVFITALLTGIYTGIESNHFPSTWSDWRPIVLTAAAATIAYLIKNFFTGTTKKT